ncbi:MAG TPA: hypothetical protein DEG17_13190 [Cyanobacteria bacterium UBA11149]|nr:hypothetical protein [Cyanobacteria bacterium UBA11366]HBK65107.1 hypothetical protein [Cyanobacteria bacterium UBA11166]HBR73860.1 hypothetical protein [Cyanobacteria bacterium UBA11159]HBS68656.1 hypothetical protein [Cyanobacteria bacterium UBA11153]HBW89795.1 hypothetical protein [Cyanobacteria bacterium UBA11149]HCA97979.1 hypothetical protein [Cyanobacteria bacterium UBA9226]
MLKNIGIWKRVFRLRAIYYSIFLGLLSLLVVTKVFPLTAQDIPVNVKLPILDSREEFWQVNRESPLMSSYWLSQQQPITTHQQLEEGRILYQTGRFAEAATLWQKAATDYEEKQDRNYQSLSLSYLSLAYQELGQWQKAETAINQSLSLITHNQPPTTKNQLIFAQILNTQASLQLATGKAEAALNTWKEAEKLYRDARDETGIFGSQINQAQALQTLGFYRRSQIILEDITQKLIASPDSSVKVTGLLSLGVALQVVGNLEKSEEILQQSLSIAEKLEYPLDIGEILFSLANTAQASAQYEKATALYEKTIEKSANFLTRLEAQINYLNLLVKTEQWRTVWVLLPEIQSELATLLPSRAAIYAQVNLAHNTIQMRNAPSLRNSSLPIPSYRDIAALLNRAIEQAKTIQDMRGEAYALGELGFLYEETQDGEKAEKITQKALNIAQSINADNIAYRWQWQMGRILKNRGNLTSAIPIYTEAVKTLKSLRSDLVAINTDVQFSFRDSVEPVYREFVSLLLASNPSQENLEQARKAIESLQLAELDNFFREACLEGKSKSIDEVDPTAAVIYPIILPERLAVILSLPGKPLAYYKTELPQTKIEEILNDMLQSMNPAFSNKQRLRISQQVYDWLIKPAESQLIQSEIKTLVFVLDGGLRSLPMAALYDGEKYLVEKYSVAISQGLQLLEARSLNEKRIKVLTGGITEARQGFSALPGVEVELKQIGTEVNANLLLNQDFTKKTLEDRIKSVPFPVIHLATHGQFSSKAEDTFLLTWNDRINVKDLDRLLRSTERSDREPIELLVLSACQTATGDRRATLGLAGVAVRSGARSTLATLWSVRDASTAELMTEFYRELTQTEVSKAEALRQAQLILLKQSKYQHPFFWAPFVLVGNWL